MSVGNRVIADQNTVTATPPLLSDSSTNSSTPNPFAQQLLPAAGFIYEGPAPDSDQLTLRFALAGKNISGLHDTLTARSTPGNAAFRQWLSADEIKTFLEPSSETLAAFEDFTSSGKTGSANLHRIADILRQSNDLGNL
ncbi:hypothetical protein FB45DRAFT_871242 [Roridomyces roridus]|uniref:Peptidase S53 activation domain-containing protein n=1 Tax=Roridomyces roridus TaxID=1738132 RepID=A0AAD7FHA9_9AGAR|nr:hypothetical protein FB45DRAFT_871242 [Roridomyces roridus]